MIEHEHVHEHSHGHPHVHGHVHDPEQTKKISNRLTRAIGHLESIKKMVEDDRDCSEVLIQLAAVESAIRSTSRQILRNHMETIMAPTGSPVPPPPSSKMTRRRSPSFTARSTSF